MLQTCFRLLLACACGRHVERFILRNEDNAVNFVHLTSLLWATWVKHGQEPRSSVYGPGWSKGWLTLSTREITNPDLITVYQMDSVYLSTFWKTESDIYRKGCCWNLVMFFYGYSLWLKLNRKRHFSLYLFIRHCLSEFSCHHSQFRIPAFRGARLILA